jgi:uncharacterized membrane protein
MASRQQRVQEYPQPGMGRGRVDAPGHNPHSTASIAGHPIHPMLIGFPIAFFIATFACDIGFWITGHAGWFDPTLWLLGAGLIVAGLAAVAGVIDVLGDARIRALNAVWWHAGGNVLVVLIEIANFFLRYGQGSKVVLPTGIILSAAVVCILLFTGWKGWEMVYRSHVGVAD